MTADRKPTARQLVALSLISREFVSRRVAGSAPSLERRGLVDRVWLPLDKHKPNGRKYQTWRITEAGREALGESAWAGKVVDAVEVTYVQNTEASG